MSSFEKHYAGLDITSSDNNGKLRPVSRVTLYVDDKNVITAGDDTGLEISADCPNATQAIADMLLARFKGFQYQTVSANDTGIDPAAELGDGITADGIYSVIAQISDDGSGYISVTAPGEQEQEDEYPMDGPLIKTITRSTDRKIADTRSSITKTAEEIRLEVQQTYATKTALGETETRLNSSITQTATSIKSEVSATYATKEALSSTETNLSSSITQTADSITSEVKATYATKGELGSAQETLSSKIDQTVKGIKLSVSNSDQSSTLTLTAGETTLSSANITFSGLVNFVTKGNLSTSGQTSINGANIQTGSISADKLSVSDLSALNATIGGWTIDYKSMYGGSATDGYAAVVSPAPTRTWVFAAGATTLGDLSTAPFHVAKDGRVYATNITATGGTIGGWTIDDRRIYGGSAGNVMAMILPSTNRTYVFSVGATNADTPNSGKFRITKDGKAYATDIVISGNSTFSATLSSATGSVSGITLSGTTTNTGATISGGTFSGGTLSGGTGGTFSSGTLSSCNLGGTSLLTSSSNGGTVKTNSGGGLRLEGTVVYISGSGTGHIFGTTVNLNGNTFVNGNLSCTGTKPRTMTTAHYGKRQLDAFETPLPTFSDYGTARLDEDGALYIIIDPIFAETVDNAYLPTVFLTKYGEGDIWVERVTHDIVTVRGTPGLEFAWETRYAQANVGVERLRVMDFDYQDVSTNRDFENDAAIAYEHSKENIDYSEMGYEYYTDFERSLSA